MTHSFTDDYTILHVYIPGFDVYCIAIINIDDADKLTCAGTPSLFEEPT